MPLVHHELCFGCGRTNLFGLLLEVEQTDPGSVAGRCFIKQDHQGSQPGYAHEGIVATALTEAMAFACGGGAQLTSLELRLEAAVPVGVFLELEARLESDENGTLTATASARTDSDHVGSARGNFTMCPPA